MRHLISFLLRLIVADYQVNRVYYADLSATQTDTVDTSPSHLNIERIESRNQFALSSDLRIRDHAWYVHDNAHVYGMFEDGELVSICAFWTAGHPRMPKRFSGLQQNEAVMVDLLTTPRSRGKGHALSITRFAENDLYRRGYTRLWTWVWHSNHPSMRVFDKAGWKYSHFMIELQFHGMRKQLSLKLNSNRLKV